MLSYYKVEACIPSTLTSRVSLISTQSCRSKSSPVFSDHVIVKLSSDQTGSSQNGGLTFVTCGFAFSMNTPVKRLQIECFVCNTPNNRFF